VQLAQVRIAEFGTCFGTRFRGGDTPSACVAGASRGASFSVTGTFASTRTLAKRTFAGTFRKTPANTRDVCGDVLGSTECVECMSALAGDQVADVGAPPRHPKLIARQGDDVKQRGLP
jgi:hypothetical protein